MKVRDFVSIIKDDSAVSIVYGGMKITEFKAPFWDTIEADILDLEIRSIGCPGKSVIIETKTGRPTVVSTLSQLNVAIADDNIKFIKLGADITDSIWGNTLALAQGVKILDLAGHAISSTADNTINVSGDARLDVFDSVDKGFADGGFVSGIDSVVAVGDASVYLHNGVYYGGSDSVDSSCTILAADNAKVYIYGGYYANSNYDGEEHSVLFANEADNASITCYGGRFKGQDPSDYLADGYQAVKLDETDPVVYEVKKIL